MYRITYKVKFDGTFWSWHHDRLETDIGDARVTLQPTVSATDEGTELLVTLFRQLRRKVFDTCIQRNNSATCLHNIRLFRLSLLR